MLSERRKTNNTKCNMLYNIVHEHMFPDTLTVLVFFIQVRSDTNLSPGADPTTWALHKEEVVSILKSFLSHHRELLLQHVATCLLPNIQVLELQLSLCIHLLPSQWTGFCLKAYSSNTAEMDERNFLLTKGNDFWNLFLSKNNNTTPSPKLK